MLYENKTGCADDDEEDDAYYNIYDNIYVKSKFFI